MLNTTSIAMPRELTTTQKAAVEFFSSVCKRWRLDA